MLLFPIQWCRNIANKVSIFPSQLSCSNDILTGSHYIRLWLVYYGLEEAFSSYVVVMVVVVVV